MTPGDRLSDITLDDSTLPPPTPEIEQERRIAIFDLLEENRFTLLPGGNGVPPAGPYRLALAVRDRRLTFDLAIGDGTPAGSFQLSLTPFSQVIRDYFQICDSYHDAVKRLPPAQIEAIDTARREIHDEGSRIVFDRLSGHAETDFATARRLFTLICVLRFGG